MGHICITKKRYCIGINSLDEKGNKMSILGKNRNVIYCPVVNCCQFHWNNDFININ